MRLVLEGDISPMLSGDYSVLLEGLFDYFG